MKLFTVIFIMLFLALQNTESIAQSNGNEKSEQIQCLFFFIPDCPACKSNMQPLMELKSEFESLGVQFSAILSDPEPNFERLRNTVNEHNLDLDIAIDSTLEMAKNYGVTTTPQFIVTNKNGELLYSGAMNNYYYEFGRHRSKPNKHYLFDALRAVTSGKKPTTSFVEPVGCKINYHKARR